MLLTRHRQGRAAVVTALVVGLLAAAVALADYETLYTWYGDAEDDRLGSVVSGAGDVDADGYADVIVVAPNADVDGTSNVGVAYVKSGYDGSTIYAFEGDAGGAYYGQAASGAGDVNADGFADVILGSDRWYEPGQSSDDAGIARVMSGEDGTILYEFEGSSYQELGTSVGGAGDVDADGYDDLIVGCAGSEPRAFVYSGYDGSTLYTFYADVDRFGESVSGAGDVNDDGYDDVIVGACGDDDNGTNRGSARIYSGEDGTTLYTFYGDGDGDALGRSVSGAGDVNADGYADVIVGMDLDDDNGSACGGARVYSGKDGKTLHTFYGDDRADHLGISVSGAGDVNDDGYDDVVAGAYGDDDNGLSCGSARIYSGKDGTVLFTLYGDDAGHQLGRSVSGAGDVDGDGQADVIVGAPYLDTTDTKAGAAYVLVAESAVDAPPAVAITAPVDGSTVSGSSVSIAATATDDDAVSKVEFFLGTTSLGTDTTSPYGLTWDSTDVADGDYTVSAKATDSAGQTATDSVDVTVANATPETLAKDDFESGGYSGGTGDWVGAWAKSGDVAMRNNRDGPHSGRYHVRLRRGTGYLARAVDLAGATKVTLRFYAKMKSFESSDQAWVKVSSDGSTYTTVKTFADGDDDNQYHLYEIDLSGHTMTDGFEVVFEAGMSGRGDYWWVDDVEIIGVP